MAGYISEFRYVGGTSVEFIEVAIPAGTDTSSYQVLIYGSGGSVVHAYSLGTAVTSIAGDDVYVLDTASTPGYADLLAGEAIALVNDLGQVEQFISYGGATVTATSGPANGLTSTSVGSAGFGQSVQSDNDGASYYTQNTPNKATIPCFAPGTLIATPDGARAVESLRPGDAVLTRDHGAQPVAWTCRRRQSLDGAGRESKPVMIRAGALGRNVPSRDLTVSPQHRILIGGGQLPGLGGQEALVPAKALTGLPGIRHMMGRRHVAWTHFACARHELVLADGCWSETLLLGHMVIGGLSGLQRRGLGLRFGPETQGGALNGPPARPCLTVGAARTLVRRALAQGLCAA